MIYTKETNYLVSMDIYELYDFARKGFQYFSEYQGIFILTMSSNINDFCLLML